MMAIIRLYILVCGSCTILLYEYNYLLSDDFLCVCVSFVMCGCVYVWVFVMCGCVYVWVFVMCVCVCVCVCLGVCMCGFL
jgi:hypothetical protein